MTKFEDLSKKTQTLILAKLAAEMTAQQSATIYHLAKLWETDVTDVWRTICRKAAQPICTIPVELMSSHRREAVRKP